MPDSNTVHMEVIQYQPAINKEIWSHDATTIEQCKQAFIDGKRSIVGIPTSNSRS